MLTKNTRIKSVMIHRFCMSIPFYPAPRGWVSSEGTTDPIVHPTTQALLQKWSMFLLLRCSVSAKRSNKKQALVLQSQPIVADVVGL